MSVPLVDDFDAIRGRVREIQEAEGRVGAASPTFETKAASAQATAESYFFWGSERKPVFAPSSEDAQEVYMFGGDG
jgi:hypothetical protein